MPDDDVPVLLLPDELELLVVLCVEPGSTAATAPAASRLATPTVAVAVFSLRRPRSRSATARETCRAAPWPRGSSVTVVPAVHNRSVASLVVGVVEIASQQTMSFS